MIEALVALVLVMVAIAAIGSLMFGSNRGVRSVEDHLTLLQTARLLVTSLPSREDLAPGSLSGELLGQRWRLDIEPFSGGGVGQIADSTWSPRTLRFQIKTPSGATLRLETIRLQQRKRSQ